MAERYLLAIDVGNTQISLGLFDLEVSGVQASDGLVEHWKISTNLQRTDDELAGTIGSFFRLARVDVDDLDGVAVCSAVPRLQATVRGMIERFTDIAPVIIGPGVKTGIPIRYDNPREAGADRIANAVAAWELFGGPTIVVDLGTATNYDIVSENGEFLGGAISPGLEISLDALADRTAALASFELRTPRSVIGTSTVESLQSGALYGYAASVDGMVGRFRAELGGEATVVATGGLASMIAPVASTVEHVEPYLALHGLRIIHSRNS
jgi:type III pantothenate kinase